jgi:hypothetical protein
MKGGIFPMASLIGNIQLTFDGIITDLITYEYHKAKGGLISHNRAHASMPTRFSTDMTLGIIYSPIKPSDFLVLDEPSPGYTELNWKDFNHSVSSPAGSHYLHYSEAHTQGYHSDTFYSHRVEFSNGGMHWFLEEAWGNGNDRYDLLYDFLNRQDLFRYEEHAYTALNWSPSEYHPNLIRIGQVATGNLTLIAIGKSSHPILESNTAPFAGIDVTAYERMTTKVH